MRQIGKRIGNTIYLGLLLVVWTLVGNAQVNNPSIISVTTAPSGTCAAGLPNQQVASTGVQYSCQNGTWAAIGGGGSGTVTAVTGTSPVTSTGGTTPAIACPTCGVTGSNLSQFATGGTIGPKIVNGVSMCGQYTGATADVQLNACITDAETRANGNTSSIADARGMGGAQTFVAPVHCGDTSSDPVTVLMPANGTWTWTATGSTTDFDVDYYTGCRMEGNSTQPTGLLLTHTSPNGTAAGVMGPGPGITGSGYTHIGGFSLAANSTAVVGNAVLVVSGADNSVFHDMNIEHFSGGMKGITDISANGSGMCCGASVVNITTDAEYSGGTGLDLEASSSVILYGINLENLSLDHPATGSPAFLCNDTQATGGSDISINGLHEELNRTSATIATANVITGCGAIHAQGVVVNDIAGSSTTVPFSVGNTYATSLDILGLDMRGYTLPNTAVTNSATGNNLSSASGHVGGYFANNLTAGQVAGISNLPGTSPLCRGLYTGIDSGGNYPDIHFCDSLSVNTNYIDMFDNAGELWLVKTGGSNLFKINAATNNVTTTATAASITYPNLVATTASKAPVFVDAGTTFSVAGCGTSTSLAGGPTGGKFVGGSATCTPVVTMGASVAAPTGWACYVSDQTTSTALFRETASNTTTATFTAGGVVGATDTITFACIAY